MAGVTDILVITGNKATELEPLLETIGVGFCRNDKYKETSMLDSAKIGFAQLAKNCDAAFFLPADTPLFMPHSIRSMTEAMAKSKAAVIQPRYRGKGGHPILIAEACFERILTYNGEEGLRGALSILEQSILELELPDPGLVLDADTPDDFTLLSKYAERMEMPSSELCIDIQNWFTMGDSAKIHSRKVAEIAIELSNKLAHAGHELQMDLVLAGALLHDIAKGNEKHAELGAKWIQELGYPSLAAVVAAHMDLPSEALESLDERAVVYLADKMVQGDAVIPLEERFAASLDKFQNNEEVKAIIMNRMETAKQLEASFNDIINNRRLIGRGEGK